MATLQAVVFDLIVRAENSARKLAELSLDTGIKFTTTDIVEDVERGLPAGYPAPTRTGADGRRELIATVVNDVLGVDR